MPPEEEQNSSGCSCDSCLYMQEGKHVKGHQQALSVKQAWDAPPHKKLDQAEGSAFSSGP